MAEQENTQAVVLQQPNGQKVYLDLNHSTDTTAIWSFIVTMVIALVLGGLATFLAYWYGKRSFDLTKQSFDSLIFQIKSSEEVIQRSNKSLIEAQNIQQLQNLKIELYKNSYNDFKKIGTEFIVESENFATFIGFMDMQHAKHNFSLNTDEDSYDFKIFKEIQEKIKIMQALKIQISFAVFNLAEHMQDRVNPILNKILLQAGTLNNSLMTNNPNLLSEIVAYKETIKDFKLAFNHLLKEEILLEKIMR